MLLTHGPITYSIEGRSVASNDSYRVYVCSVGAKQYLLQIASEIEYNGEMDRAAYVLNELKQMSDSLEADFAKLHPDVKLSYDQLFPTVFDSFVSSEQGGRRINILELSNIDAVVKMAPLSNLLTKDKLRISLETSGWMMGRLLKLLYFIHPQGISISIASNNILIGPERHRTVVLDWSLAKIHQEEVPIDIRKSNIADVAKAVFAAIGGDVTTGNYPYDENNQYIEFLLGLARSEYDDASKAHSDFYKVVYSVFGKKFYPFVAFPL